jgi:hypothetical protein
MHDCLIEVKKGVSDTIIQTGTAFDYAIPKRNEYTDPLTCAFHLN